MPYNPLKALTKIGWLAGACMASAWAVGLAQPTLVVNPSAEVDPSANLSLTIRCLAEDIEVGDPIPIEFTITNQDASEYSYMDRNYDRGGRMNEYELSALNAEGKTMPDPRASLGPTFGGGLSAKGKLAPGASFQKTIDLNRWALIREPGVYQVTGNYSWGNGSVMSKSISVTVKPRTLAEMDAYVSGLLSELAKATSEGGSPPEELVQKLMYTGSPKILPGLLDSMYASKSGAFWQSEAILCYVPVSPEIRKLLLEAAVKRGLAPNLDYILSRYGAGPGPDDWMKSVVTPEEIWPAIARSLAEDNPERWDAGALAAQRYGNDAFTARLIALAEQPRAAGNGPDHSGRTQAIYALALNRTDDSVKELKKLLESQDRATRSKAAAAIRTAYLYRGDSLGRPLHMDDFDESYQNGAVPNNLAKGGAAK